ncbi:hexose kinase [Actinokineospora sp. NBRC 105648]|uniref:1-phosphofructokinase family hexose kinase n=1 Tax=Actinokineospora sp. NBRC 105648 TaxID=3032206 RepID=UPI0024A4D8DE|nr:hexose kinase [Actinokineospora sp. NBRC 105648]GLZ43787.1 tagatose-6-phosphate kinase [Actinokineospora sp. NBRC 105648]
MILTVTGNPALDVSYRVDRLRPGHTHRIRAVHERAGGKGFNVSRVLHEQGVATLALGPIGGILGDSMRSDLADSGVPHDLLPVAAATRMTIAVVATEWSDGDEATMFNEPGGPLSAADWSRLGDLVRTYLSKASVLVCSGSLPPDAPEQTYADLVELARTAGVPTVVDAGGPVLRAAAQAGADVLKPNAEELAEAVGEDDPLTGARALRNLGAGAVVVSLGAEGMLATTADGEWKAAPSRRVAGNPTGAGDAAVAALADGLRRNLPWEERLRTAVAWSAGAVAAPTAGSVDDDVVAELFDGVVVTRL